jgi:GH18 family chitinase
MWNKKIIPFFLSLGICSVPMLDYAAQNYETYLESWDAGWQTALEDLPPASGQTAENSYQNVTLDIAFAAYVFTGDVLNGVQFSIDDVETVVDFVRSHGGKVKISFGGASYAPPYAPYYFISQTVGWPDNIDSLAAGVISVVNTYNFDGVDFDIEDQQPSSSTAQQFASQLISFLQAVRAGLPDKIISITIPGQGWGQYWQYLAQDAAAIPGLIDYINFMEYDIWINSSGTYSQQIAADILTYQSPPDTSPPPNWSPGWGIPVALIQMGLMPGDDDLQHDLTLDAAEGLAQTAVNQGLYGVMTWDIDRDAGTDPNPPTNASPYAFSSGIREVLETGTAASNPYHQQRMVNKRIRPTQVDFIRQSVPPHGAP